MSMIETKNLRKVFGPIEAVKGVSFRVDQGEVLGFLGPNGAGKSTVMRMLTCFLTPTSGTASVGGHDVIGDSMAARRLTGYLPETNPAYGDMTVERFLNFIAEIRGFRGAKRTECVGSAIERCAIQGVRGQTIETLSKGFRRRVGLAQTLLHDPRVLILDEPTDGLDPNQKHEVRELIHAMASNKVIVISTHILEEVEAICTRAIIIAEGRIVADGTPADLQSRSRYHGAVRLAIRKNGASIDLDAIKAIRGVRCIEREASAPGDENIERFEVIPTEKSTIAHEIVALAREKKWQVEEITVEKGRLDEVFRTITTQGGQRS
jgi:ABC-2 type transport system ATP-binding protein